MVKQYNRSENVASNWEEKVWWKCHIANDHIFEASIKTICRSIGNDSKFKGCLVCSGRIVVKSKLSDSHISKVAKGGIQQKMVNSHRMM